MRKILIGSTNKPSADLYFEARVRFGGVDFVGQKNSLLKRFSSSDRDGFYARSPKRKYGDRAPELTRVFKGMLGFLGKTNRLTQPDLILFSTQTWEGSERKATDPDNIALTGIVEIAKKRRIPILFNLGTGDPSKLSSYGSWDPFS